MDISSFTNRVYAALNNRDQIPRLNDLGGLYHDYSIFGVKNKQLDGIFNLNQRAKGPIIMAYIQYAIAKSKIKTTDEVSFTELFCADGYYAMVARHFGATKSRGIDNNRDGHFVNAKIIAERLGIDNIEFIQDDVNNLDQYDKSDIVANIGGLYHISNPEDVLKKSYNMARKYLIIQSVVSLANESEDYFESPAPGWTWGCRFSRQSFNKLITGLGYDIIDSHFNELEGNERLEDRGSLYYLIKIK